MPRERKVKIPKKVFIWGLAVAEAQNCISTKDTVEYDGSVMMATL